MVIYRGHNTETSTPNHGADRCRGDVEATVRGAEGPSAEQE